MYAAFTILLGLIHLWYTTSIFPSPFKSTNRAPKEIILMQRILIIMEILMYFNHCLCYVLQKIKSTCHRLRDTSNYLKVLLQLWHMNVFHLVFKTPFVH